MRRAPAIPLGTCFCAWWCEWYMPTAGPCAVNSYVKVSPGLTGGWVTSGTPSMLNGTSIPCQCTPVDIGNWFVTMMRP